MKLRPYQIEAVEAVFREWEDQQSTLLVLPTGCGKTVVFADIIRRHGGRAMVLAHREELIFQARDKIALVAGFDAAVEMGEYRVVHHDLFNAPRVIVSTVQTHTAGGDGGGRMTKFEPSDFGVLVIDEAHHATSQTYRRCVDWYAQNEKLKILGVTATPDRADEEALGQVFGSCAFDYEILDAINDGWLVSVEQQVVHVAGLDFTRCRTTAGDLNGADLAEVMEEEKNLHAVAVPTLEIAGKRRALVFAASVVQAERMAEIFNRYREGCAAWLCGKTPKDERRKILLDFASGAVQFVVNVGVLTEGFDDSGIEIIVMARPTKSRALYAQMAGRGTRPADSIASDLNAVATAGDRRALIARSNKPKCLIVDFCGNSGRHKLMTTADILGGKVEDDVVERAATMAREAGKPVDMAEALAEAARLVEEEKKREAAKRAMLSAKARFSTSKVNPFDVLDIKPTKERGWNRARPLSEKQKDLLTRNGVDPDSMKAGEARQILDEMFRRWNNGLATYAQSKLLKRNGIFAPMRREEASRLIDQIAIKQGWKK